MIFYYLPCGRPDVVEPNLALISGLLIHEQTSFPVFRQCCVTYVILGLP
jgi:hypothetical protein